MISATSFRGLRRGLDDRHLYEGRDLQVTTDFRTVLSEAVNSQLTGADSGIVFPGFSASRRLGFMG